MALIDCKNVEKTYYNDGMATPAVRGMTFNIKKGESVAIMGPSGSGKSTLLHILGFLDRPTKGTYLFDGKSMDQYSEDELAEIRNQKMGFVFQTFNLLARATVLENVKLSLLYSKIKDSMWDEMALRAITSVGLAHRVHHTSSQLSGGERQRVAIARALVNEPEVIFADEPTGNLDSKSGQVILEIFQRLNEEKNYTIILITHETYVAEHAHRIIHVLDGKIEKDQRVENHRKAHEQPIK